MPVKTNSPVESRHAGPVFSDADLHVGVVGVGKQETPYGRSDVDDLNATLLSGSYLVNGVRPLHCDMESAGVFGAIRRVQQRMRLTHGYLWDAHIRRIPSWVLHPDFVTATNNCNVIHALSALGDINTFMHGLQTRSNTPRMHHKPMPDAKNIPTQVELVAKLRLRYGELLETYCRAEALEICRVNEMPTSASEQENFSTICNDSYLVSLWTQAHAEYLFLLDDMVTIISRNVPDLPASTPPQDSERKGDCKTRDELIVEADVPPPDLCHLTCLANAPDLTSLYERHTSPKTCSKTAMGMLTLMMRATNTGSRGWETMLESVLKESDQSPGISRWCTHLFSASFAGLHPCIHPGMRKPWQQRLVIARTSQVYSKLPELRDMASEAPTAFKEVIRLYLATLFAEDAATLAACVATHQSEGQLEIPPNATSPTSLQAAMHAVCAAGESFVEKAPETGKEVAKRITSRMFVEARSRKKNITRPSGKIVGVTIPLTYAASWMGGRSGASGSSQPTAFQVLCSITSSCFRGTFVPLWMHAQMNQHRQSRLSQSQYTALHTESAMHKLTRFLDDKTVLKLIRTAMRTPNATLMTLEQVVSLLNLEYETPPNEVVQGELSAPGLSASDAVSQCNRGMQEAESLVMTLTPDSAAKIMTFMKCVALRTHIIAYDLGKNTLGMQMKAVWKRMARSDETLPPYNEIMSKLPKHATHAFVCTECHRIVNACVDGTLKAVAFNEIGLSASMLRIDGDVDNGHLRCAKRSSAALRTAVALEDAANTADVECQRCTHTMTPKDLRACSISSAMQEDATTSEASGETAKLRRDVKSCFEQNPCATACGDVPLVFVPLLGRAVRIYSDWYCICAFCGALFKMTPMSRFRGEPCCSRCDYQMLFGAEKEAELLSMRKKPTPPICRYCGKPEPETCTNKWKVVFAPLDTCGRNVSVPPPLRTCHYCPSHFRTWVANAHRVFSTPVILCHISARAKPLFGADGTVATTTEDDANGMPAKPVRKKRPRKLKPNATPQSGVLASAVKSKPQRRKRAVISVEE